MRYDILILNTLSSGLGALLIAIFTQKIYYKKYSLNHIVLFVLSFSLLNGFLSTLLTINGQLFNTIKPLILIVLSVFIMVVILKLKVLQSTAVFFVFVIGLAIGNAISIVLVSLILGSPKEFYENDLGIGWLTVSNIIVNITAGLFLFVIKPIKLLVLNLKNNVSLSIMVILTFFILIANFALHYFVEFVNLNSLIIISVLSILYCSYIVVYAFVLTKKVLLKEDLEQQKFYNKSLESSLFNLRRFKHDWNNNLTVINTMLALGKIAEAKSYLKEITEFDLQNDTLIYNLKNAGLFGIISSEINKARDKGLNINLNVVGEIENIPGIKISELCEILGIFLDNAIEESLKSRSSVDINISDDTNIIKIQVANNCINKPDLSTIFKAGYSTKGADRGMGLAIAKDILSKYKNMHLNAEYKENTNSFMITIIIEKGLKAPSQSTLTKDLGHSL